MELAETAKEAESAACVLKLQGRFQALEEDLFTEVPRADIYILKLILHDWPEEQCLTILRNIRRSMAPESRLFIVEELLDDTTPAAIAAYLDLTMLTALGGRERTFKEYCALLRLLDYGQRKQCRSAPSHTR